MESSSAGHGDAMAPTECIKSHERTTKSSLDNADDGQDTVYTRAIAPMGVSLHLKVLLARCLAGDGW